MRLFRSRSRLFWSVVAVAVLAAGSVAIASGGPSANPARAQTVSCASGTDVQTTKGPVCGIATSNGADEWLGIPYAAPPVGSLRWASPQPHASWTTTLKRRTFLTSASNRPGRRAPPAPGSSEDCLYLNVWAPAGGGTNLPVMVHIHGGGLFGARVTATTR